MVNIQKIVLLSALLMSASSIIAPTYAMDGDEQGVSAPRVTHAQPPYKLTQGEISEIRQHGSFSVAAKEYVLQNPEQLETFANCLSYHPCRLQFSHRDCGNDRHYYITEYVRFGGHDWPNELSRLIFKEQDPAPAKPLVVAPKVEEQESGSAAASSEQAQMSSVEAQEIESAAASSVQASMSSDSSSEGDARAMIIRSLTKTLIRFSTETLINLIQKL